MTNNLNLAWETFDFYNAEISNYEAQHINNTKSIGNLLNSSRPSYKDQRDRLKAKSVKCIDTLIVLYKKQLDAISDLIDLNDSCIDIPAEKEIDTSSLFALKNVTSTLMHQMNTYKEDINDLFK